MVQLIYASAATIPFSTYGLRDLLDRARLRNTFYDVSGMLLFHSGYFLQVLEGPAGGVHAIYTSVTRERRHRQPRILSYQEIARREFGLSPMGFADLSRSHQYPDGFSDFYLGFPDSASAGDEARHILAVCQHIHLQPPTPPPSAEVLRVA